MQYPLKLRFKLFTFSPKILITDRENNLIGVVKKRLFKLKEHILVYKDLNCETLFAEIKTNQILDWSALYTFTDCDQSPLGSVGREGMASLWKARYTIFRNNETAEGEFLVEEENPVAKIFDSIFVEIPIIGLFSSFFFHPRYAAKRINSDEKIMRLTKKASLIEGRFQIDCLTDLPEEEEIRLILGFLMLTLLERKRG